VKLMLHPLYAIQSTQEVARLVDVVRQAAGRADQPRQTGL
jgi:hypothetical protein